MKEYTFWTEVTATLTITVKANSLEEANEKVWKADEMLDDVEFEEKDDFGNHILIDQVDRDEDSEYWLVDDDDE